MKDKLKRERTILKGFELRDNKIVSEFVNAHYQSVESYIIAKGGSRIEVEDIVQEALMVLFNISKTKDFVLESKVSDYFFGIVKNLFNRRFRTEKVIFITEAEIEIIDDVEDINDFIVENEKYKLYETYLNKIDSGCKELFEMIFSGMKTEEILEKTGFTVEYFYKKKSLCKKNLLEKIKNDDKYKELILEKRKGN